ncbi:uncharacterized protein HRG_12001 [Hirsutella rhossiliensis]|uniref:Uncharacterized protein n=1 Tax=Hirsutella rhossiliensis TaxID=111463 RepID=A0A9P8MMX5_9HYPO|nr:uncharacterized protein HRG_12001 [Hirsutella rhossiliensis]KAH0956936.1 hypothetical protein HRG_12001 [Hirsutella rhossiliensis]
MPSSRVYHHEEDAVNNLTALINPKIDVRDNVKSGRARKKFTSEFRIENCQSKWSQNVTS